MEADPESAGVFYVDGQPFFVVTREVDPGLLSVLREKVVPWLIKEHVPNQPDLQNDPHRPRLTIVFDREGG